MFLRGWSLRFSFTAVGGMAKAMPHPKPIFEAVVDP
jgi:hypothetical protein